MVDAGCPDRLNEARQILEGVLGEEMVAGKPLVIFANKQDQSGALSPEEVRERLGLNSLSENQRQSIKVVMNESMTATYSRTSNNGHSK